MNARERIDITFDFRSDTPLGKDPDAFSPTLRRYHKLLWSKPLPNGTMFDLDDTTRGDYLHHKSELGEYHLTSDAVVPSFRYVPMVQEEAEELREFLYIGYTIGGMMLFPGNQVGRKPTPNGARGLHPRIRDRFDLTVECIRRHYLGETSPLSAALARYADFFELFVDFRGFVEFFLLQDAVTVDCDAVIFSAPLRDFSTSSVIPQTTEEYREYRQRAITFIEARNRRILQSFSEDRRLGRGDGQKSVRSTSAQVTPPVGTRLTVEAVLELAGQCGTRNELERAMQVVSEKGLRVRAFKTCLMFTPPSNGTRCLFTLWAKREGGQLSAYVSTEAFTEFFPLERADVEKRLGPEGWRHFDESGFEAFLKGVQALELGS
jgi:hypothetical protein